MHGGDALKLSSNQPCYLPWEGFIERTAMSDVHVIADLNQYSHRNVHNRNRILKPEGVKWITVPVVRTGQPQRLNEVRVNGTEWRRQHRDMLRHAYGKAPYFRKFWPDYEKIYAQDYELLVDYNVELIKTLLKHYGVEVELLFGSELKIPGRKGEKLFNMCVELGADTYITTPKAKEYLPEDKFERAGIEIVYHVYESTPYSQGRDEFVPNLSAVDRLFWTGGRKPGGPGRYRD